MAYPSGNVRHDVGLQAGVNERLQLGCQLGVGRCVGHPPNPSCCCRPCMSQMRQGCKVVRVVALGNSRVSLEATPNTT